MKSLTLRPLAISICAKRLGAPHVASVNVELHVLRQAGNHYQNSSDSIGLDDDDYLLLENMIGCCSVFKTALHNALVFIRDSRSREKNSSC